MNSIGRVDHFRHPRAREARCGIASVANKKVTTIEAFLVFLFTTEILRLNRHDQVMQGILPADRKWIVTEMRAKAAAAGMNEREYWQEAVDFWSPKAGGIVKSHPTATPLRVQGRPLAGAQE